MGTKYGSGQDWILEQAIMVLINVNGPDYPLVKQLKEELQK